MKKGLVLMGCLLAAATLQAAEVQHPDSTSTALIHRVSFDLVPSYVFPTRPFLRGNNHRKEPINHTVAAHLKYGFQFGQDTRMGRLYPYTSQGIGIGYNTFFNQKEMGTPISLYAYQSSRICQLTPKLSFDYEWNFGISCGWKKYDADTNDKNRVVGSKTNAYIHLSFLFNWQLSPHWNFMAGLGGTHFSNGNTHTPNMGVNIAGARVSLSHTFNPDPRPVHTPCFMADPNFRPYVSYDLIVYGSTRKKGVYDYADHDYFVTHGIYAIFGLNFNPIYHFNQYFGVGGSLDVQYDESANIKEYIAGDNEDTDKIRFYQPPLSKQLGVGLSVRGELTMPFFTINLGIGKNFIGRGHDLVKLYQVFAMKAHLNKNIFLHVGYQLYEFKEPNNLMLGLGYTFHAK